MTYQTGRSVHKRKSSYLYSILSVTLVLFLLGIFGILMVNAKSLSTQMKENVEVSLELKDGISDKNLKKLKENLSKMTYHKSLSYTSKAKALESFKKEYPEDFESILGFNPLYASLSLKLKENWSNLDSLKKIEKKWSKHELIADVYYPKNLVDEINQRLNKIGIVIFVLSLLLLFIAMALIDSTIKLAMYSNRFLIKSMQLVGATRKYISKPFIKKSIYHGFISGLMACILLAGFIYFAGRNLPEIRFTFHVTSYFMVYFCIILLGMLISWWSTRSAVVKYLKLKLDDLY